MKNNRTTILFIATVVLLNGCGEDPSDKDALTLDQLRGRIYLWAIRLPFKMHTDADGNVIGPPVGDRFDDQFFEWAGHEPGGLTRWIPHAFFDGTTKSDLSDWRYVLLSNDEVAAIEGLADLLVVPKDKVVDYRFEEYNFRGGAPIIDHQPLLIVRVGNSAFTLDAQAGAFFQIDPLYLEMVFLLATKGRLETAKEKIE